MTAEGKILVHLDTERVNVYRLQGDVLTLLRSERAEFGPNPVAGSASDRINELCDGLTDVTDVVDNKSTRLYATGVFQQLSPLDADHLVNRAYVDNGLYFNIVDPELERFYLVTARSANGSNDIMEGVVRQEFRSVVVCGSFQQSLGHIEDTVARLRKTGAVVLSPPSTRIKSSTANTDFVLFDYQDDLKNKRDTWRHKYEHMDNFRHSDAIVVCNPGGGVGNGTMFELGFMCAVSARVIFTEEPTNVSVFFPYEVGLGV